MHIDTIKDAALRFITEKALQLFTTPSTYVLLMTFGGAALSYIVKPLSISIPLWCTLLAVTVPLSGMIYFLLVSRQLKAKVVSLTPPSSPPLTLKQIELLFFIAHNFNLNAEPTSKTAAKTIIGCNNIEFDVLEKELIALNLIKESRFGDLYLSDLAKKRLQESPMKEAFLEFFDFPPQTK